MKSVAILLILFGITLHANAQGGGMLGGMGGMGSFDSQSSGRFQGKWPRSTSNESRVFPSDRALAFITVDGVAEIRVAPEKIRVVMAVTGEGENAVDCQSKVESQIKKVREAWSELKISDDDIVEDFIAVLPRFEWHIRKRDDEEVRIQERVGYRMQANLHVSVPDEPAAMRAINSAFQHGVTDIVTFDYWSSKLDEEKQRAIKLAMDAAKRKAETLLSVFDQKPKLINVQEHSGVFFPRSLYRTYQNVLEEEVQYPQSWRDLPVFKAFRPRKTFFDGLKSESDVRPKNVDMHPEISIASTVRLYYQSPATKNPVPSPRTAW